MIPTRQVALRHRQIIGVYFVPSTGLYLGTRSEYNYTITTLYFYLLIPLMIEYKRISECDLLRQRWELTTRSVYRSKGLFLR